MIAERPSLQDRGILRVFQQVKELRSLTLPSLRNAIVRNQIECLLEYNTKEYVAFLAQLESALSNLRVLSQGNKLQKYHQERFGVEVLFAKFAKEAKLSFDFDKILIQSIVDVYCGRIHIKLDEGPSTASASIPIRTLTYVELNAIAYTSGYIIHKLHKQSSKDSAVAEALAELLEGGQMAKESIQPDDTAFYNSATTYLSKADRGGLTWLPEPAIQLFCRIDDHAFWFAQELFKASSTSNNPPNQQHAIQAACDDEGIATKWSSLVGMNKDEEKQLLHEIVAMWLNLRAHSFAAQQMETCKRKTNRKTEKKGLRKTLKQKPPQSTANNLE